MSGRRLPSCNFEATAVTSTSVTYLINLHPPLVRFVRVVGAKSYSSFERTRTLVNAQFFAGIVNGFELRQKHIHKGPQFPKWILRRKRRIWVPVVYDMQKPQNLIKTVTRHRFTKEWAMKICFR